MEFSRDIFHFLKSQNPNTNTFLYAESIVKWEATLFLDSDNYKQEYSSALKKFLNTQLSMKKYFIFHRSQH